WHALEDCNHSATRRLTSRVENRAGTRVVKDACAGTNQDADRIVGRSRQAWRGPAAAHAPPLFSLVTIRPRLEMKPGPPPKRPRLVVRINVLVVSSGSSATFRQ